MYKIVKQTLEQMDALAGSVFPVSELVRQMSAPFAIVDSQSATKEKALNGAVLRVDEVFEIGFESEMLEDCIDMADEAAELLEALSNTDTDDGRHIISVECSRTEQDAFDMATELMRRPLRAEIRWYEK